MIKLLPHWALTDLQPAFYDVESKTAIEMVARLYSKMQELVKDYNGFIDEINKTITDFQNGIIENFECFKNKITEIMTNYIESIDLRMDNQDQVINDAIKYMKDNLITTMTSLFYQALQEGEIYLDVLVNYDAVTGNLEIGSTARKDEAEIVFPTGRAYVENEELIFDE